jgi:hypothetical protein
VGRTLVANKLLAGSACGKRRRGRPLNSVVSQHRSMSNQKTSIAEDRPLTPKEAQLTAWLLEHGTKEAHTFTSQLPGARVISRCACGCASVDFSVNGHRGKVTDGMVVLSDHQWRDTAGHLFGAFVFAYGSVLGGLDVWSIDGLSLPKSLPEIEALRPLG